MLYRRFLPVVYRYVLIRVGDPHHTEDVTADTFFAMVEGIARARASDELGFAAWVLGIARNKVAMHFRQQRTRGEVRREFTDNTDPQAIGDEDDPLTIITARESWGVVSSALQQLTEEQRSVVLYRCVLGYSTEDVAALLQRRPKAIRALQSRALASLARHLGINRQIGRHAFGQGELGLSRGGRDHAAQR
jgi:RNA polymerase sigma-70 factor (ECF subfamily)